MILFGNLKVSILDSDMKCNAIDEHQANVPVIHSGISWIPSFTLCLEEQKYSKLS